MAAMGIFYHNPRAGSDFDVLDIFNFLLDCRYLLLSFVGLNFLMPLYVWDLYAIPMNVCVCRHAYGSQRGREGGRGRREREREGERLAESRAKVETIAELRSNSSFFAKAIKTWMNLLFSHANTSVCIALGWIGGFTYQRITAGILLFCNDFLSWLLIILLLIDTRLMIWTTPGWPYVECVWRDMVQRTSKDLLFLSWRLGMGQSLMKMCTIRVWDIHSDLVYKGQCVFRWFV